MSSNNTSVEIPNTLPLLPVRDMVVFPYMILPLYVGRESSIQAVEKALTSNRLIFLSSQIEMNDENPKPEGVYKTGTIAMIMRMRKLSDGRVKILAQGIAKGQITEFNQETPFFEVNVEKIDEPIIETLEEEHENLMRSCREKLEKVISLGRMLSPDILLVLDDVTEPGRLADLIASNLGLKIEDTQRVLEQNDAIDRLKLVEELLLHELDVMKVQSAIKGNTKDDMSKSQREYFLREQMRAIKSELGEGDQKSDEIGDYKKKIEEAGMPDEVSKEVYKQLARLERMHPDASESSMIRNYLDWITDLPWSIATEDSLDIRQAKEILDADHFDLEKVKERILEFLAVRQLKDNLKGPILCFAGPPGVGKTSLGKSIARAMGRNYQRLALGGVKDEAEIRGHRRTYVGAMPGKIIQCLKQAGTNNPVIVLDEIDKLGSDFRGDPSAAMLEVLDPEQNNSFKDNYINSDFDLSNVLFIATANVLQNIPPALRDRMEVIHIPGYTENDKLLIAKKHLVTRQVLENGLTPDQIEFKDDGLSALISGYTREAGLRNLEREVGSVCRKVAKKVVEGHKEKIIVDQNMIYELMGPARFIKEERFHEEQVGISTGLAWTQVGGEILYVEALSMKGKGGLTLTGQLGDVMKESATAALSYAKAHYDELGINPEWFEKNNIHIHLPAGAIPKDGPSAGITLATALISLMTETPVRMDVAMTGELTLTGRVLPVGGIREKALAALNQGISNVVIPFQNKKDIEDIPKEFKEKINFILVENIDEVLQVVFKSKGKGKGRRNKNQSDKTLAA